MANKDYYYYYCYYHYYYYYYQSLSKGWLSEIIIHPPPLKIFGGETCKISTPISRQCQCLWHGLYHASSCISSILVACLSILEGNREYFTLMIIIIICRQTANVHPDMVIFYLKKSVLHAVMAILSQTVSFMNAPFFFIPDPKGRERA